MNMVSPNIRGPKVPLTHFAGLTDCFLNCSSLTTSQSYRRLLQRIPIIFFSSLRLAAAVACHSGYEIDSMTHADHHEATFHKREM